MSDDATLRMHSSFEEESSTWAQEQIDAARAEAKELADETQDEAERGFAKVKATLRQEARSVADRQRRIFSSRMTTLADAVEAAADTLHAGGEEWSSEKARAASRKIRDACDYCEEREASEWVRDVRSLARRHPSIFMGAMAALGLALGRFLRSSRPGPDARPLPAPITGPGSVPRTGVDPRLAAEPALSPEPVLAPEPALSSEPFGTALDSEKQYVNDWS